MSTHIDSFPYQQWQGSEAPLNRNIGQEVYSLGYKLGVGIVGCICFAPAYSPSQELWYIGLVRQWSARRLLKMIPWELATVFSSFIIFYRFTSHSYPQLLQCEMRALLAAVVLLAMLIAMGTAHQIGIACKLRDND